MGLEFVTGIIATVFFGIVGWMWNNLNNKLEKLQTTDDALKDKIGEVHLLVAGQYVKNEALDKFSEAIFRRLDQLEKRIDENMKEAMSSGTKERKITDGN